MRTITPHYVIGAIASLGLLASANAAYIIEASDEIDALGLGKFAYTGTAGTAASYSTASGGQLPSVSPDSPPTFFTLRHAYGGNGAPGAGLFDQYTFTYSPGVDLDNTPFAAATVFNLRGALPDLASSGLSNGEAGFYNIYRIHPGTPNVTLGNTATYVVQVNGGSPLISLTIDQNAVDGGTGENIGRWELIGNVGLSSATDVVTVTMTPNGDPDGFVSMRASGIMFEYVGPIPEPSAAALIALGALALVGRRRR